VSDPRRSPGPSSPRWTDQQVDLAIGRLLQAGVAIAAVVVLIGTIVLFVSQGHLPASFSEFRGEPRTLTSAHRALWAALHGDRAAVVQVGLVLLILTPVARVAFTLVAFWLQRDRLYVLLSGIVLLVIVYGLFLTRT
jgi:uncharacterized membrane protein